MAQDHTDANTFFKKIARQLEPVSESQHAAFQKAVWLAEWATKKSFASLLKEPQLLDQQARTRIQEAVEKHLTQREPLQYIFGNVDFLDLTITVEPPILIPRPETEAWVSILLQKIKQHQCKNLRILDLCTGTGCIALAIAKAFPDADVIGVDNDQQACNLAVFNAQKNGIKNCTIIQSDLYQELPAETRFHLIVANPPYVSRKEWLQLDPVVRHWESEQALLAGDDGLDVIKDIISGAPRRLVLNTLTPCTVFALPRLVIEIGATQATAVIDIFNNNGFDETLILKDLSGDNRAIAGGNYVG